MAFDRRLLPDPQRYYESQGLKLVGNGRWRTTRCEFHGGSDSLRINVESGGFCCMAHCGAKGGDVLAYHQAKFGLSFSDAAKDLGALVDDGKPVPRRPTALSGREVVQLLAAEANLVAIAAANMAAGVVLSQTDLDRLLKAAGRILRLIEVAV